MPAGDTTASTLLASLALAFSVDATNRTLIQYTLLLLHVEELENAKGGLSSQSQAGFSYTAYELTDLLTLAHDELRKLVRDLDSTRQAAAVVPATGRIARKNQRPVTDRYGTRIL